MSRILTTLRDDEWTQNGTTPREEGFGALETERGRLPLKALAVHARLEGLLSQVNVTQTYVNTFSDPVEATYIFPLPDRAAVTNFRMEVNGRVIEGQLKERGQARADYTQAIRQGHRAAITEEERPGVFTLRVGNLLPGEEATITLTFSGPLVYSAGEATFRFPLVVAPRYIPGTALPGPAVGSGVAPDTNAVPDASRISPPVLLPGFPNPVRLSLSVEVLPTALILGDARSSLHAIEEERAGRLRWISVQPGERLNRDFILRFRVDPSSLHSALTLQPDSMSSQEGTFLLTLVPPLAEVNAKPRDVVFVLDRSGSMGGWKMVTARRAVGRMVDTLLDHDRFTILAFDDSIETPQPDSHAMMSANDRQRFRAIEWLAKVEARGGTELAAPLGQAVEQLLQSDAGRERIVVLITDGQVGNEDQILRDLGKRLKQLRVFTLGIDQAVNAAFLQRLAELGGGSCELVESEDRLDDVMEHVHRRIGQPVLSHLQLEPAGLTLDGDSVVPERAPDLFPGVPVLLMGRYTGRAEGAIVVHATDTNGAAWSRRIAGQTQAQSSLASVWARAQIRKLEDMYLIREGEKPLIERQILATSLRFQVLSRFTAYVAVDRSAVVNPDGKPREITQPVEMPAGWAQDTGMANCLSAAAPLMSPPWVGQSRGRVGAFPLPPAPPAACAPEEALESIDSCLMDFDDEQEVRKAAPPLPPMSPRRGNYSHSNEGKKKRSLLGKLRDALSGGDKQEEKKEAAAPVVVPGVETLLQELTARRGDSAPVRLAELRRLGKALEEVVKALKATAAPSAQHLEDWLRRFRAFQSRPVLDVAMLDQLWTELEQGLQSLMGVQRTGFWK